MTSKSDTLTTPDKRTPTGIAALDEKIYGGLPEFGLGILYLPDPELELKVLTHMLVKMAEQNVNLMVMTDSIETTPVLRSNAIRGRLVHMHEVHTPAQALARSEMFGVHPPAVGFVYMKCLDSSWREQLYYTQQLEMLSRKKPAFYWLIVQAAYNERKRTEGMHFASLALEASNAGFRLIKNQYSAQDTLLHNWEIDTADV